MRRNVSTKRESQIGCSVPVGRRTACSVGNRFRKHDRRARLYHNHQLYVYCTIHAYCKGCARVHGRETFYPYPAPVVVMTYVQDFRPGARILQKESVVETRLIGGPVVCTALSYVILNNEFLPPPEFIFLMRIRDRGARGKRPRRPPPSNTPLNPDRREPKLRNKQRYCSFSILLITENLYEHVVLK